MVAGFYYNSHTHEPAEIRERERVRALHTLALHDHLFMFVCNQSVGVAGQVLRP